jgi:hypothetical protein
MSSTNPASTAIDCQSEQLHACIRIHCGARHSPELSAPSCVWPAPGCRPVVIITYVLVAVLNTTTDDETSFCCRLHLLAIPQVACTACGTRHTFHTRNHHIMT